MAIKRILIKTPAKINLGLRIKGLRRDGYHEIETRMQMVGLFDELIFERAEKGIDLIIDGEGIPPKKGNMVYNAFMLLSKRSGGNGVRIRLKKQIPVASGLGGGSSDGAATLVGLNRLWRLGLTREDLMDLAKMLGSDVPFFLFGPSAFATGRGEILRAVKPLDAWILLIDMGFQVSTTWAYKNYDRLLTKGGDNIKLRLSEEAGGRYINNLERVTIERYPEIRKIKEVLVDSGAKEALMSGSGPAVFGIFSDRRSALEASKRFKGYKVFTVKTLTRSPFEF